MVDILAFGAHPDDVELSAAGTLIKHIKLGYSVGIIDLTMGRWVHEAHQKLEH